MVQTNRILLNVFKSRISMVNKNSLLKRNFVKLLYNNEMGICYNVMLTFRVWFAYAFNKFFKIKGYKA